MLNNDVDNDLMTREQRGWGGKGRRGRKGGCLKVVFHSGAFSFVTVDL